MCENCNKGSFGGDNERSVKTNEQVEETVDNNSSIAADNNKDK